MPYAGKSSDFLTVTQPDIFCVLLVWTNIAGKQAYDAPPQGSVL